MFKIKWLKFRRDIPGLVDMLKESDLDVRMAACWALHDMRNPRSVELLVVLLQEGSPHARRMAAWTLWGLATQRVRGAEQAAGPLNAALCDPDLRVRENACRALADLAKNGHGHATELLIAALADASVDVRMSAARLLGYVNDGRVVEALITALGDSAVDVRTRAALALGKQGDGRAVEPLTAALEDQDERVRYCAGLALERIRNKKEALTDLLSA